MSLVDGIGGVFLFSNNPKQLADWYRENLGISYEASPDCSSFYKSFAYRDFTDAAIKRTTTWAILPSANDINGKSRTGQINYRVKAMAETLAQLRSQGVMIEKTEDYEYGKFAWLTDPDGNKIELYEEPPERI
jgi:catechol 2,3-dioxygenase-like lactoylglutathione lyase family enzyme